MGGLDERTGSAHANTNTRPQSIPCTHTHASQVVEELRRRGHVVLEEEARLGYEHHSVFGKAQVRTQQKDKDKDKYKDKGKAAHCRVGLGWGLITGACLHRGVCVLCCPVFV